MRCRTLLLRCVPGWVLVGLLSGAVLAQAPRAVPPQNRAQAPGFYRMMLGDFEVTTISDGTVTMAIDKLLTNVAPAQVAELLAQNRVTSPLKPSINTFLIHTGQKLVLVDAGAGRLFEPNGGGRLVANLRAAGYQPDQVDAVLLTHIHADHSAGLTVDGVRVFPNAAILVNQAESNYWLSAAEAAQASASHKHSFEEAHQALDPYIKTGQLQPFESATKLFPGITSRPMPGHTPGHTFYEVESRGQKIIFVGDTVHVAEVQFPHPAATVQFDVDSPAAARQRLTLFTEAASEGFWIGAAHISFPGIGHVRTEGPGFAWVPAPYQMTP